MKSQLTFVHVLSPLHAGIGQGAGVIDLPIAREKATDLPFLPGSSIKGALRTSASETQKEIFGSDPADSAQMRASAVLFTDQRLLLLPVRSIAGTFAWVTSPYVLQRFVRDLIELQGKDAALPIPQIDAANTCIVTSESKLKLQQDKPQQKVNMVYLEDFDLEVIADPPSTNPEDIDLEVPADPISSDLDQWAQMLGLAIFPSEDPWQTMLKERLCLVHDDLFHFMCQYSVEITTRIKLKEDTKTVDDQTGGLWHEEALPTETVLTGIVVITPTKNSGKSDAEIVDILKGFSGKMIQFGGKATVGRGMCRVHLG
jgi:CRISPR-associated protein Cmr4